MNGQKPDRKIEITGDGNIIGDDSLSLVIKRYSRSEREESLDYLAQAVATYQARMYQLAVRPVAPPDQPYKFLYAFEIEDAGLFFGRDVASEALYQTIFKDHLTVLHARSGAGKTSLLNAGLLPRLIREGRLPVYARAYEDPVLAVKRAIAPPSKGPWPERLSKLSLHEFLGLACKHLSRETQELVIIFDQFEEFFVFWPEQDYRQPFIDALAACYDDKSLPVRFIISMRGDYFTHLATFRRRLPHIFHNELYLDAMSREEVQAAIIGPVAKLGNPVTYEQALLDTLLDDLARGGMELPHLQIICTRLYEALAEGGTTITLASYKELGRVEGVLGSYVGCVLDRLPGQGADVAKAVLKELVSSEGTRRMLSRDTLVARVQVEEVEPGDVLDRLVDARLLRRDEVAGGVTYEMAHEYLINEIIKWIDQEDLEFKQAQELLAREVANWRVHGTPIPEERLELLLPHRERFRGVSDEAWECILLSTLESDFSIWDWAELSGEAGVEIFVSLLDDERGEVRRTAAEALGRLGDRNAVEPLITSLQDDNAGVREAAAAALGRLGDPCAIEPLNVASWEDRSTGVLEEAANALVMLGMPSVDRLIQALRDERWNVRLAAAERLGELRDPRAVEPLNVTLRVDQDADVVGAAALALVVLGVPLLDVLTDVLPHKRWNVRQQAVEALGECGDPRAVDLVIVTLSDKSANVRRSSASALGKLGDLRAMDPLISALRDKSPNVRSEAAWALGKLGVADVIEPLIAALQDNNANVRRSAAEALRGVGDPRAVEPLAALLQDEDSVVRWTAVNALEGLGDPCVVESLIVALKDRSRWMWDSVQEVAARTLGKLGDPRAVEPLIDLLREGDGRAREMAARALGEIADPRAVGSLVAVLEKAPQNRLEKSLQQTVAEALRRIGTPEALSGLERALFGAGGAE